MLAVASVVGPVYLPGLELKESEKLLQSQGPTGGLVRTPHAASRPESEKGGFHRTKLFQVQLHGAPMPSVVCCT